MSESHPSNRQYIATEGTVIAESDVINHLFAVDRLNALFGEHYLQLGLHQDQTGLSPGFLRIVVNGSWETLPLPDLGSYWLAVRQYREQYRDQS